MNSSILNKENSLENTLNGLSRKQRQSTANFIESESSYVKVDCSDKSSQLENWNSIQHLQSNSMMMSKMDNPDQTQHFQNNRKIKLRSVYSSKMDAINSQSKLKDLLNSLVKKIFKSELNDVELDDTLYLYVTKNSSYFELKNYLDYLNILMNEQESIW